MVLFYAELTILVRINAKMHYFGARPHLCWGGNMLPGSAQVQSRYFRTNVDEIYEHSHGTSYKFYGRYAVMPRSFGLICSAGSYATSSRSKLHREMI